MKEFIKKEINIFNYLILLYIISFFIIMNFGKPEDIFIKVFLYSFFTFIPIMSVLIKEQYEDKMNGLKIFRSLPISLKQIILIKFSVSFVYTFIILIFNFIFNLINLNQFFYFYSLIIVFQGLIYSGIFKFGYINFFKILLFVAIIINSFFILVINYSIRNNTGMINKIIIYFKDFSSLAFFIIGVFLYIFFYFLSILILKKS